MKENEFYIEETSTKRVIINIFILCLLIGVCFIAILYYKKNYTLNIKKKVTYEVGSSLSYNLEDYITNKIIDKEDYTLNFKNVENKDSILTTTGEYTYKVKYKSITKTGKIIVKDTVAPKVETQDVLIGVGEDYLLDDFIRVCEDYSKPCLTTYKNESDENLNQKVGVYSFDIVVSDQSGNKVTKKVKLEVKKNYSREGMMKKEIIPDHIDPKYDDWQKEMFTTFKEGVLYEEITQDEDYNTLLDLTKYDLQTYLSEEYRDQTIRDFTVCCVYNKYKYIIGYAIRVEFENGDHTYLHN